MSRIAGSCTEYRHHAGTPVESTVIRLPLLARPMAQDLDIRHFLRRAPKPWLRRYFDRGGVLAHIDWSSIRVRNIEPLMDGLRALDEDVRGRIVQDFSEINLLSTPAGKVQIIDEAAVPRQAAGSCRETR